MDKRKFVEDFFARVWGTQDFARFDAAIDELVAEDCVVFGLPHGNDIARKGFKQLRRLFREAFDRTELTVDDFFESGDRYAYRASFHLWRGAKQYTIHGSGFATMRDGQLVDAWNQWDFLGLLAQLEVLAPTALVDALTTLATRAAR